MFREVLAVVINERFRVLYHDPGVTENVRYGKILGYETAIQVLNDLASGAPPAAREQEEPDYGATNFGTINE